MKGGKGGGEVVFTRKKRKDDECLASAGAITFLHFVHIAAHPYAARALPLQSPRLGCKAEDGPGRVMILCARRGDQRSWERASTVGQAWERP